jgi:hypothetical protein
MNVQIKLEMEYRMNIFNGLPKFGEQGLIIFYDVFFFFIFKFGRIEL